MTKPIPAPEQRVRDFIEHTDQATAEWPEGHYNRPDDVIDAFLDGVRLTVTDIKDVLKELEWHRERVEELEEQNRAAVDMLHHNHGSPLAQRLLDIIEPEGDAEQGYEITAKDD